MCGVTSQHLWPDVGASLLDIDFVHLSCGTDRLSLCGNSPLYVTILTSPSRMSELEIWGGYLGTGRSPQWMCVVCYIWLPQYEWRITVVSFFMCELIPHLLCVCTYCTLHFDRHWEQFFSHCSVSRCTTVLWSWFKPKHHARSITLPLSVGCQPAAWSLSAHHVVKQRIPPWG